MNSAVLLECLGALTDVFEIVEEYGTAITVKHRNEEDVTRGSLGTIKKRAIDPLFSMKAYPVERQPDERILEKAGLRETVDVVIWTPMRRWIDLAVIDPGDIGNTFAAIDITRTTIILDGYEWVIADKGLANRVGEIPTYITFGLRKR